MADSAFKTYKINDEVMEAILDALMAQRDAAQHEADTCGNVDMRAKMEKHAMSMRYAIALLLVQYVGV